MVANPEDVMDARDKVPCTTEQLAAVAKWHHEKANEAGREGQIRDRDRHIAIRNKIRSQING